MKTAKFFEELLKKEEKGLYFEQGVLYAKSYQDTPPSLLFMLNINEEDISDKAASAIQWVEEQEKSNDDWLRFKWKLWAFLELQDLFDTPIYKGAGDYLTMLQAWYFYYESRYILMEALLTGFNGFYHSSENALRSFLEFSILQNYYYLDSRKNSSYMNVVKCLKTGIKPKISTLIRGALPKSVSVIPIETIKGRLTAHYEALSSHCMHPYHEDFSPRMTYRISKPGHSLMGIMTFWRTIDCILEAVLWMYYVNFPMILQPKDVTRKFGCNPPLGIFLDLSRAHIMKNALKKADIELFQKYSDQDETVKSLNEWYSQRDDLTLEEIKNNWNEEEDGKFPGDIEIAYLQKITKLRAIREMMSLGAVNPPGNEDINFSIGDITLAGWSYVFSKQKKRSKST